MEDVWDRLREELRLHGLETKFEKARETFEPLVVDTGDRRKMVFAFKHRDHEAVAGYVGVRRYLEARRERKRERKRKRQQQQQQQQQNEEGFEQGVVQGFDKGWEAGYTDGYMDARRSAERKLAALFDTHG